MTRVTIEMKVEIIPKEDRSAFYNKSRQVQNKEESKDPNPIIPTGTTENQGNF